MIPVLLVALSWACDVRADDAASSVHFAFEVDFVQIEVAALSELGHKVPSDRFCHLGDIQAFFLRQLLAANNMDTSVYGRSKSTFPDGKSIVLSNHLSDNVATKAIRRNDAWIDTRPIELRLLPKLESASSLSMTVSYSLNNNEEVLGPSSVSDGTTILVLLERRHDTWRGVLITPRIIAPD
jgi:hypothetical protein